MVEHQGEFDGFTPLDVAKKRKLREIAALLREKGCLANRVMIELENNQSMPINDSMNSRVDYT
jgi:hypothetical protein